MLVTNIAWVPTLFQQALPFSVWEGRVQTSSRQTSVFSLCLRHELASYFTEKTEAFKRQSLSHLGLPQSFLLASRRRHPYSCFGSQPWGPCRRRVPLPCPSPTPSPWPFLLPAVKGAIWSLCSRSSCVWPPGFHSPAGDRTPMAVLGPGSFRSPGTLGLQLRGTRRTHNWNPSFHGGDRARRERSCCRGAAASQNQVDSSVFHSELPAVFQRIRLSASRNQSCFLLPEIKT